MSARTTTVSTTHPSIKVTARLQDVLEKPIGSADHPFLSHAIHRPSSGFLKITKAVPIKLVFNRV